MKVLVSAIGSAGDVHPFLPLSQELQRRGHDVVFFANETFRPTTEACGLRFAEAGSKELYDRVTKHVDAWHPTRGPRLVFRTLADHLRESIDGLLGHVEEGNTVLVGSTLALGARILRDSHRLPLVTVHLQPAVLRTVHAVPALPGFPTGNWVPTWTKRLLWWAGDRMIDGALCPGLNREREHRGLAPVRRPLNGWFHSPDRVIGLFPEWFGPRQPDWPAHLELVGFPLFHEDESGGLSPTLEAWLKEGPAPVAITAGSANVQAGKHLETVMEACGESAQRALLLAPTREGLPTELPIWARYEAYVPFGRLLPRCAALVHHGGIGTSAQAFAAGIPQLVTPFAHDQPDNAARIERLGAGRSVDARRLDQRKAVTALMELVYSKAMRERCQELAPTVKGEHGVETAVRIVEEMAP